MNDSIVVDASAGVEIALRTPDGAMLAALLAGRVPYVPDVYYVETAAALRRLEIRKVVHPAAAQAALAHLHGWRVRVAASRPLVFAAWPLRHNLTIADAIYVVLARQLAADLVTGDRRIARAPNLGIAVHTP